jgi:hypothetical protein
VRLNPRSALFAIASHFRALKPQAGWRFHPSMHNCAEPDNETRAFTAAIASTITCNSILDAAQSVGLTPVGHFFARKAQYLLDARLFLYFRLEALARRSETCHLSVMRDDFPSSADCVSGCVV